MMTRITSKISTKWDHWKTCSSCSGTATAAVADQPTQLVVNTSSESIKCAAGAQTVAMSSIADIPRRSSTVEIAIWLAVNANNIPTNMWRRFGRLGDIGAGALSTIVVVLSTRRRFLVLVEVSVYVRIE